MELGDLDTLRCVRVYNMGISNYRARGFGSGWKEY